MATTRLSSLGGGFVDGEIKCRLNSSVHGYRPTALDMAPGMYHPVSAWRKPLYQALPPPKPVAHWPAAIWEHTLPQDVPMGYAPHQWERSREAGFNPHVRRRYD